MVKSIIKWYAAIENGYLHWKFKNLSKEGLKS